MDRRNITNNIISSLIGTIVGFGLTNLKQGTLFQWCALGFLLLVLFSIYAFTGPLNFIFKSRKKYDLEGDWISKWSYLKNRKAVLISEKVSSGYDPTFFFDLDIRIPY